MNQHKIERQVESIRMELARLRPVIVRHTPPRRKRRSAAGVVVLICGAALAVGVLVAWAVGR